MCNDMIIRRFAGVFVLLSLALAYWMSPLWLLFTAFVGVNLLQSSFTRLCPLENILAWAGFPGCRTKPAGPEQGGGPARGGDGRR
jgi:hypothetical protein